MGEFNVNDDYIYYCEQDSYKKWSSPDNQQKQSRMHYLDTPKMLEWSQFIWVSVESFSIKVTEVYALTTDAEELMWTDSIKKHKRSSRTNSKKRHQEIRMQNRN